MANFHRFKCKVGCDNFRYLKTSTLKNKIARKHLSELEAQFMPSRGNQMSLFQLKEEDLVSAVDEDVSVVQDDPDYRVLTDILESIDPDALTPREALQHLYEMKEQLKAIQKE